MRWRTQMQSALAVAAILVGLAAPAHAAFPGKNGKIAFERGGEIYTIHPDGTGETRLTNSPDTDIDYAPRWSADGSKIVFVSRRDDFHADNDIFTMNADGTGRTNLTNSPGPEAVDEHYPSWSPDGTKIVFATFGDIYVMNADGTGQTNLTDKTPLRPANQPVWSPDGTKIAFISNRDGDYPDLEIFTMNADGTGQTNLTNSPGLDFDPDWSPDGTKIAFRSVLRGVEVISTMNADGTGRTSFTNSSGTDSHPVWSPDGTKIAFTTLRNVDGVFNAEIYVMNADGTGQANLTNSSTSEGFPDWQPVPGPQRGDYKNAAKFCKGEHEFLGEDAFRQKHGGGANAYGKCVSGK